MLAVTESSTISTVTTNSLLIVFAEFLDLDVSAGDAATDTLKTYTRQLQQFLSWCDRRQLNPVTIAKNDMFVKDLNFINSIIYKYDNIFIKKSHLLLKKLCQE